MFPNYSTCQLTPAVGLAMERKLQSPWFRVFLLGGFLHLVQYSYRQTFNQKRQYTYKATLRKVRVRFISPYPGKY
jgi:hypothetical protein